MEEREGRLLRDYGFQLITDPSFMGALLGAILTGAIAIFIMNRTNVNNTKRKKKKILNDFIKESRFLLYALESLIGQIKIYVKYQKEEELITNRTDTNGFPTEEITEIAFAKKLSEADIAESLSKIKSVKRNAFTKDSFELYLNILSVVEGQIEYFWKRSLEKNVHGVGDILEDANKELGSLKDLLEYMHVEKGKVYDSL